MNQKIRLDIKRDGLIWYDSFHLIPLWWILYELKMKIHEYHELILFRIFSEEKRDAAWYCCILSRVDILFQAKILLL